MARPNAPIGRPAPAILILAAIAAIAGCGGPPDGLPRRAVDGMVIYDGSPLPTGSIEFESESKENGKAMHAGGPIFEGKFSFPRDEGLVPGRYKVIIYAAIAAPQKPEEEGKVPRRDIIPARYNAESILTAEIKDSGFNVLEFILDR